LRDVLTPAVEAINAGGLVIVPTETVYGLAADARNEPAVERVFATKGRDTHVPLPIQVPTIEEALACAEEIDDSAEHLMRTLMPGPLTVVVKKSAAIPDVVTAGSPSVGIRIPDHCVALELLRLCGCPLVMTSVNRSGEPPITTAATACAFFGDKVDVIIDGDACEDFRCGVGIASTVIDLTQRPPELLRLGPVSVDTLRRFLPDLSVKCFHE